MTAPTATIHCQEFHELAMDYRAALSHAPKEAYERMVAYIDAEIARRVAAIPLPAAPVQGPTSEQIQKHPAFGVFLCALGALAICNMDEARDIAQRMRDALDIQPPPVGENE